MPGNEVIQRTEQLIKSLRDLAKTSDVSTSSLQEVEKVLNRLVGVNLNNIRDSALLLADFSKQLRGLGAETATVNQLTKSFAELLSTIQATIAMQDKMSALGKTGRATQLLNKAIAAGDVGEQQRQQNIITQQKALAEQANETLAATEQIWKRNLDFAKDIEEVRARVIRTLYGRRGSLMELPSGLPREIMPQLPPGYIAGGTGQPTGYIPPPPSPPTRYPQLPPYTPPPRLPMGPILQPTGYVPPQLMPGAVSRFPLLPSGPMPGGGADVRRATTRIDEAVVDRINQDVEQMYEVAADRGVAGATLGTTPGTVGGRTRGGGADDTRPEMYRTPQTVSAENLRTIGLSDVAAKNLEKTMKGLGMTSARAVGNVTELSTGIQTVSFQMTDATGAVRNFTAHLDRNGNVLADTQKRFRSFGSAVMRDVVEVLKWTIAITAIYTPIRKLGELLDEMKKIQLDMVDVQIVLGDSTNQFSTVLEASAQIATQTSSSLEGVIEGYALAAAAASSAGDEMQRTVVTQSMLKDSMVLAKLANIDQKQALDTLVGSLSQLGMGLTQGTQLLDSWVAVSKKANVSVNQMATSFTIVGSAAQEAGVNYNELNALIGALAQSTNLSADELGNAIRGIIAAMQTDKAQQSFAEYGIATKTVSGDFRDLMEILKQLKQMSEAGILDEKAMGALTQAGGAGARRGAQLSALVKNLDVVMNLVTVSENASGDAAEAMALEMGTLDAATTRLNNAFTELAITLGEEGGVLGFLTAVTNMITTLVKGVRDLTSVLKVAAPILATFMLAKGVLGTQQGGALLNKNIPVGLASMFMSPTFGGINQANGQPLTGSRGTAGYPLSNWLLGRLQRSGIGAVNAGYAQAPDLARTATVGEFFGGMWNRMNTPFATMLARRRGGSRDYLYPGTGGTIPLYSTVEEGRNAPISTRGISKFSLGTMLGPLLISATQLAAGGPGAGTKAAISGGAGLLVAALTGSPMWATIGSIIATGFYDKFLTFEDNLVTVWAAKMAEARTGTTDEDETTEQALERLNREARESMGGLEIFKVNAVNWMMNTWSKLPWSTQGGKQVTPEETALGLAIGGEWAGKPVFDEETRKKLLEAYNKLVREQAKATEELNVVSTPQQEEIARLAATASADIMNKALEQISLNAQGSIQNYLNAKTLAQKIGSTVNQLINAQMLMMQEVTIGVGPTAKTITPAPAGFTPMSTQEAIKFVSELDEQSLGVIVSYYTEISDILAKIKVLNDQIAGQTGGVASETQQKDLDAYATRLASLPQEFTQMLQAVQQGSVYSKLQEKFMPTISLPEMTPQQYQQIATQAEQFWREYLKASGLTQAEIDLWVKNQNDQLVMMENRVTPFRTNVPQEYFTPALEGAGITGQMPGLVDWQQYTMQQFQQAQSMYPQFIKQIQTLLPTWKPEETDALYFLQDSATVAHLDQTIMQMLMRDLIDIEEDKGLQGMYNLPSGATFYVPVTAYELHRQTQAGMAGGRGGISEADIMALLQQAIAAGATQRLQEAQAAQEAIPKIENLQALPPGEGFEFGGQQYTMFGPPAPTGQLLGYTSGNPLPVTVTNWLQGTSPNATPVAPYTLLPDNNQSIPGLTPGPWANGYVFPNATPVPPATTVPQAQPELNALEKFFQWLSNIGLLPSFNVTPEKTGMTNTQGQTTTALSLAVDQRVTLTVDGRTLATIIKPYLYEDLIRFNTATNSSISKSVIA